MQTTTLSYFFYNFQCIVLFLCMQLKLGDFLINIRSLPNEIKMCRMWTSNVAHQLVAVYACAEVAKTPISNVKLHAHVYVFVGLCTGRLHTVILVYLLRTVGPSTVDV